MKRTTLLILLSLIILISCSPRKVFEQYQDIEDMNWNRFKSLWFEFDISNTSARYDLTVMMRHHTAFPFANLPMTIAIYTPSGERRLKDIDVWVRNPDGSFRSSGMGDLWDIEHPLFKGYTFNEKGHYKLEIENRSSKVDNPGVMEVGVRVERAEREE